MVQSQSLSSVGRFFVSYICIFFFLNYTLSKHGTGTRDHRPIRLIANRLPQTGGGRRLAALAELGKTEGQTEGKKTDGLGGRGIP